MKIRMAILVLIFLGLGANRAWGNPFRTTYVCIPPLNLNGAEVEFEIREGGDCREGEQLAKVVTQGDDTVLLYPTAAPLAPDVQHDWDEYKKYYGGD